MRSGERLTETFTERTAGIWLPIVFYAAGGVYMLVFWGLFSPSAYHLLALGAISVVIAVALFLLSRWAYWLGLFTFPLLAAEFVYALTFSVNVVGWYLSPTVAVFNASMVVYLFFLCFSFLLLIDRRNTLKSDRFLDRLRGSISAPASNPETPQTSGS
jgi:hypothetical protein